MLNCCINDILMLINNIKLGFFHADLQYKAVDSTMLICSIKLWALSMLICSM